MLRFIASVFVVVILLGCEQPLPGVKTEDRGGIVDASIQRSALKKTGENYLPIVRGNDADRLLYAIDPDSDELYLVPLPGAIREYLPIYQATANYHVVQPEASQVNLSDILVLAGGKLHRVSLLKNQQLLNQQVSSLDNIGVVCDWYQYGYATTHYIFLSVIHVSREQPAPEKVDCVGQYGVDKKKRYWLNLDWTDNENPKDVGFIKDHRYLMPVLDEQGEVEAWLSRRPDILEGWGLYRYNKEFDLNSSTPIYSETLGELSFVLGYLDQTILLNRGYYSSRVALPTKLEYFSAEKQCGGVGDSSRLAGFAAQQYFHTCSGLATGAVLRREFLDLYGRPMSEDSWFGRKQDGIVVADGRPFKLLARNSQYSVLAWTTQTDQGSEIYDFFSVVGHTQGLMQGNSLLNSVAQENVLFYGLSDKYFYLTVMDPVLKDAVSYVYDLSSPTSSPTRFEKSRFSGATYVNKLDLDQLSPELDMGGQLPLKHLLLKHSESKTTSFYSAADFNEIAKTPSSTTITEQRVLDSLATGLTFADALVVGTEGSLEYYIYHFKPNAPNRVLRFIDAKRVIGEK